MKLEVQNNVPGVKVRVNQNADGSFAILLEQMEGKTLGSVKPGNTVTIGEREYIVLGHGEVGMAIIPRAMFVHIVMTTFTKCFVRQSASTTSFLILSTLLPMMALTRE